MNRILSLFLALILLLLWSPARLQAAGSALTSFTVSADGAGTNFTKNVNTNPHFLKFTTATSLPIGGTIRIVYPGNFTIANGAITISTFTAGGAGVASATVASNVITVTTNTAVIAASTAVTIEIAAGIITNPNTNNNYNVTIETSVGDFGLGLANIGTDNQVIVAVNVLPSISFSVTPGTTTFGDLTTTYDGNITVATLEVGTNAASGTSITATSTNGGLLSPSIGYTIKFTNSPAGEGYKITTTINNDPTLTAGDDRAGVGATEITNTTGTTIYTNSKPEQSDATTADVTVLMDAKVSGYSVPAGSDYTDTITFSVTATF